MKLQETITFNSFFVFSVWFCFIQRFAERTMQRQDSRTRMHDGRWRYTRTSLG